MEEKDERDIITSLDSFVVLDYIKSSVDIILNLKFEEIEKRLVGKEPSACGFAKYGATASKNESTVSLHNGSSSRSNFSNQEGPPKVYEEIIQSLEADVRKHIRVFVKF